MKGFVSWLRAKDGEGNLIGWFGKNLVMRFENLSEDDKDRVSEVPLLNSKNSGTPLFHSVIRYDELLLLEFPSKPTELTLYFEQYQILDVGCDQDFLEKIRRIPSECADDLEMLAAIDFFEINQLDQRHKEERLKLYNKAASRVLAVIAEDRKPVPAWEQEELAFA